MDLLEAYGEPDDLYLARLEEVNPHRPLFTGDVYESGAGAESETVIVLAHPCSIRGRDAQLLNEVLVATVSEMPDSPPSHKWSSGYFRKMPLPDLGGRFRTADFQSIRSVSTLTLSCGNRIACLSQVGVNLLQQRMIFHLTRFVAPTRDLDGAFCHTFIEAELLEEWVEAKHNQGASVDDAAKSFDEMTRSPFAEPAGETMQDALRDPQKRAAVRKRIRKALSSHDPG